MKKKLPQCLFDKQAKERAASAKTVTNAIVELASQGYNTRIKDIMYITGLSRSVFSKPHIRRILIEYGIVDPRENRDIHNKGNSRGIDTLLAEKDGYIDRLLLENEQMRHEIEILRGEIHLLTYRKSIMDNNDF